ncbi:MAG: DinB family protein [Longimicrobiales bacterium]
MPTIAEMFLAELDREMPGTRRALERVPEGKADWKPHPKSMALGYLAALVATMPAWAASMAREDELDLGNAGEYSTFGFATTTELLQAHDDAVAKARKALTGLTDEHLMTTWRLRVGGHVVQEQTRHIAIRDGCLNHLAHHRGQLTVYLRLNDMPVPSLYGPTADERPF